jgi:Alkylmercury lyase
MPLDLTDVRLHVYRRFAADAVAVTPADVAAALDGSPCEALAALRDLDDAHLVVLDRARERIVLAHPWSADPLGFTVSSPTQKWWGGCAWDSFAIPALTGDDCLVATHCPACGRPLALDVAPGEPPGPESGPLVAHLPEPVLRMWDDVVSTCSRQRLFCSAEHVTEWLARTGTERGEVLDLPALWRLATGWYAGRLTPGYRRRTPVQAAAFFASIGLTSDFWRTR